jgi:hypothetical protein
LRGVIMGGGGGSQSSTTTTSIDPSIKPYVEYGLEEAKRLYQSGTPSFYPGKTYVTPSESTQEGLRRAETRALRGSPLIGQAQDVVTSQMGYTSPQAKLIQDLGMSAADPSSAFYRSMMEGMPESEALGMARRTASGQYLEPSPFLQGALGQANRLASESYQEGLRGLQSQASAAGRYGSGAAGQQIQKGQDVFARSLAEQNQKAYLENYLQERANQEAAIKSLGTMEQQGIANRFAGASGLTAGQQEALKTQLGALGTAEGITATDLARQYQAAAAASGMAELDYADIDKLLKVGTAREGQTGAELKDLIDRYNFEQNLPYTKLSQFANLFSSVPQGGTVTSTATPSGGK